MEEKNQIVKQIDTIHIIVYISSIGYTPTNICIVDLGIPTIELNHVKNHVFHYRYVLLILLYTYYTIVDIRPLLHSNHCYNNLTCVRLLIVHID